MVGLPRWKILQRKEQQYPNTAHDAVELQPLSDDLPSIFDKDVSFNEEAMPKVILDTDQKYIQEQTNLFRWENIAIPVCYLTVGICQGLNRPLLNVYPLDLGGTEAQQATMNLVVLLPSTMKILFGFLSDNYPLLGYRRKPYMFLGWLAVVLIMCTFYMSADLSIEYNDITGDAMPPPNAPSIEWLGVTFFTFGVGMWLADVMGDSIVAEKARLETEENKGQLQSTCYACRFFGIMTAAPLSTFCYSYWGPRSVVALLACAPLAVLPLIYFFAEDSNVPIKSTRDQFQEIWTTICSRSVWQPMGFVYLFNLLQVQNAAWKQFLKTVLHFTAVQLNSLLVVSYIALFVGTMIYKLFFLQASWRRIYQVCIVVNAFFTCLQLLLITGNTMGISPYWFTLGDDAAAEFIAGFQFLPSAMMMVTLCPPGSEGASYAMFTTAWNSALLLAPSISSVLLGIWDVSLGALEAGHLTGLFKLSVLTALIQMSPVLFLNWLPHSRDELLALETKPLSKWGHTVGGALFVTIVTLSISYTIIIGILNIVKGGES